jgi:hypothetical protein
MRLAGETRVDGDVSKRASWFSSHCRTGCVQPLSQHEGVRRLLERDLKDS